MTESSDQDGLRRFVLWLGGTMTASGVAWMIGYGIAVAQADPPQSRPFWIAVTWFAAAATIVGAALVAIAEIALPKRRGVGAALNSSRPFAPGITAGGSIVAGGTISAPGDIAAGSHGSNILVPVPDSRPISDPEHPDRRTFIYVNLANIGPAGEFKVKVSRVSWRSSDGSWRSPGIHEIPLGWATHSDVKHLASGEEGRLHLALVTYEADKRSVGLHIDDFNEDDGTSVFALNIPPMTSPPESLQAQFTIQCKVYRIAGGTQEFSIDGSITLTDDGPGPVIVTSPTVDWGRPITEAQLGERLADLVERGEVIEDASWRGQAAGSRRGVEAWMSETLLVLCSFDEGIATEFKQAFALLSGIDPLDHQRIYDVMSLAIASLERIRSRIASDSPRRA